MDFSGRWQLRSVFQHWEIIVDRFPVATARRFTWCISINAPIREHLSDLRFFVRSLLPTRHFQRIRLHDALNQMRLLFARQDYLSGEELNGADGISDVEGKAAMVAASERRQRTSFNGALPSNF